MRVTGPPSPSHPPAPAFMEKCLTMRAGQTPVQKYWCKLLQMIEVRNEPGPGLKGLAGLAMEYRAKRPPEPAWGGLSSGPSYFLPQHGHASLICQASRPQEGKLDPSFVIAPDKNQGNCQPLLLIFPSPRPAGGQAGPVVCHHAPAPAGAGGGGVPHVRQQDRRLHQGEASPRMPLPRCVVPVPLSERCVCLYLRTPCGLACRVIGNLPSA